MKLEVRGNPPLGSLMTLDAQEYRLKCLRRHQRQDGAMTELLVWSTTCPNCGDEFEATSAGLSRAPVRRCEPCRKIMAGAKVKGAGQVAAVLTFPPVEEC